MDFNSGEDLLSLKGSLHCEDSVCSPSISSVSFVEADEYARLHGLTVDSLFFDWTELIDNDPIIAPSVIELGPGELIEGPELEECEFLPIIPEPEQWNISIGSLKLLQQTCRECEERQIREIFLAECLSTTLELASLKLEPPLLYSDHTLDCRRLARQVRNFMKDPLPDISLPLEPYDVEQGQGLEFPRALVEADKEQTKSVENEKLNVTRDILWYISQTIKSDWTEENQQQLYESAAGYPGLWARRPMTPPLSPMFEQFEQYFVPDDDTCQIPVPSDPSSRLSQEIEGAEARILIPDAEFWAQALENDVFKECEDDIDISKMIKNGELSVSLEVSSPLVASRDMKIDVPLLPSYDDANASTAIPLLDSSELAPATALITSGDITSESEGPTGQLVKLFLESEEKMTRGAEQEKPQPLDPTVRVTVPVMDFSIPASEWELNLWNAITVFRWIRENTPVDWQGVKWTYSRAAEQRMVWAPIAHLKEMKPLEEKIDEDPRLLGDFFSPIPDDDIPHSEDYVYKTPGLAIFQVNEYDDDQDDYLTLQNSPKKPQSTLFALDDQPLSLSSPANTSYHCAFNDWHNSPDLMVLLDIKQRQISEKIQKKQPTKRLRAEEENQTDTDAFSSELIPSTNVLKGVMAEYTDFSSLVDNFLDMNFPKRPKLTHSSYFQKQDTFKKAQPTFNSSPQTSASASTPTPALAPTVVLPDTPPRVVVSSTVSMMVLNHLKQFVPSIELITRRPLDLHCLDSAPKVHEADIVVSPATGILLTTMINLRQRPVPIHQGANSMVAAKSTDNFRCATANVACRHSRLIVLVSENNKHSETASPISRADANALAEFQGFAAALRGTAVVQVIYVGGGFETLAKWISAIICQYHPAEGQPFRNYLLPVETMWEVFLRRVGMNAFAAQLVLGKLMAPDGKPAVCGPGEMYGLPLFMQMSRERRIELFAKDLGGRAVLDRVSEVIDEPWMQGAVVDDQGSVRRDQERAEYQWTWAGQMDERLR